jgi:hypothetical protein
MLQPDFRAYVPGQPGNEPFFNPQRPFHLKPPLNNVL